jgi:catechol 2,3-dioxygenase-like lactoylglutathione lyase family enzyme
MLHRLCCLEMVVPDVAATAAFYRDFGLQEVAAGQLASVAGGVQLVLASGPARAVRRLEVGVDDASDLDRIAQNLQSLGAPCARGDRALETRDPALDMALRISIAPRIAARPPTPSPRGPRSALMPEEGEPLRPRKLSHVVLGSPNPASTCRLLCEGLGFRVSDRLAEVDATFLRCGSDHHDVLVQPAPRAFMHHTAWELGSVDEVGRAAMRMVERDPDRQVWGLGRHLVGSNYFWYLRDPAGNFAEYSSDVDTIPDDAAWQPGNFVGRAQLYAWGPPPPLEFLLPSDIYPRS